MSVLDAVGHDGDEAERGRDREPLKVLDLAGRVGRDERAGGVEPSETGETAGDKEREEDGVDRGAETEGEGDERGSDTERDLRTGWNGERDKREGWSVTGWRQIRCASSQVGGSSLAGWQGGELDASAVMHVELTSSTLGHARPSRELTAERADAGSLDTPRAHQRSSCRQAG